MAVYLPATQLTQHRGRRVEAIREKRQFVRPLLGIDHGMGYANRARRESTKQDGVLRGININHVNLQNSDLDRSVDFYRELFSLPPKREVPGSPYALDLAGGLSWLSVPQREPSGDIDHFCVGVEDFEPSRVATAIREAGLDRDLRVGSDFVSVRDPEGIRVQISRPGWDG